MKGFLHIDGSMGEGGGQVLRTAVSLSMVTGKPIRIFNIRAGRKKPGLAHQHLTCIRAAKEICAATIAGAQIGSQDLEFEPKEILRGDYSFDVTTAGSVSLVLQTVFLPLSLAKGESSVTIRGGTHVKWSPSYEFLVDQWLFYVQGIGFRVSLRLEKAGYYPQGGGILKAHIPARGGAELRPLSLSDRGELERVTGRIFSSNLNENIAARQLAKAQQLLHSRGLSPEIEIRQYPSPGQGTGTHLRAAFQNGSGSYTSLGERGLPAARVASFAAECLIDYIDSGAAVDRFIADQLIVPLALAKGESTFTCEEITLHLLTNARVVEMFLPVKVETCGELGKPGRVRIIPQGDSSYRQRPIPRDAGDPAGILPAAGARRPRDCRPEGSVTL